MTSLLIDGVAVEASPQATVLQAARKAGISIPTLCFLRERNAIASCRLCVVEVEGEAHPVAACVTPVREGMQVTTHSEKLDAYRKTALQLILSSKGSALAALGEEGGAPKIRALCRELGVDASALEALQAEKTDVCAPSKAADAEAASADPAFAALFESQTEQGVAEKPLPVLDANPFLRYDPNLCIECQRCVGACNAAARNHSLGTARRGVRMMIEAPFGTDWQHTACESCGNCAQACPTGAISLKARFAAEAQLTQAAAEIGEAPAQTFVETQKVRTTCPHCGVGCQLSLEVADGRIVGAEGAFGASNRGLLCVKGRSASCDFVSAEDRLTTPLVRNPQSGQLEPATWDEALDLVASRFTQLRDEHGGESLAAFACSRSTNEDVYLFQKMARVALKTNNVDSCARV